MNAAESQKLIYAALRAAVAGTGLRIRRPPGLPGAYIQALDVDVYVFLTARGYEIDVWGTADDGSSMSRLIADLDVAVRLAVGACGQA